MTGLTRRRRNTKLTVLSAQQLAESVEHPQLRAHGQYPHQHGRLEPKETAAPLCRAAFAMCARGRKEVSRSANAQPSRTHEDVDVKVRQCRSLDDLSCDQS